MHERWMSMGPMLGGNASEVADVDRAPSANALAAPASAWAVWGLLGVTGIAALATCAWRSRLGISPLPGWFTVVCVPLAVIGFAVLDHRVRFQSNQWIAVATIVAAHLVLSVPGAGGPLYYRGTTIIRVDHLMHLIAGGVVAWLGRHVASRWAPTRFQPVGAAGICLLATMTLGVAKEITDFASVTAAHATYDVVDSLWDLTANAIGAMAVLLWLLRPARAGASTQRRP